MKKGPLRGRWVRICCRISCRILPPLQRRDPVSWAERHRESLCCWLFGPDTLRILTQQIPLPLGGCAWRGVCKKCVWTHVKPANITYVRAKGTWMHVCMSLCVQPRALWASKGGRRVKVTSEINTAQTTLCFKIHSSLKCNTPDSIYESFVCLFPCIYSYSCVILEYILYITSKRKTL